MKAKYTNEFGHSAQSAMLEFLERNPGWHSYADDAKTIRTVLTLVAQGKIEVNTFYQMRKLI